MAKLYLSSYRIPTPRDLFELVGAEPEDIRTAVIPNAKDYYAERARKVKIQETTDYLQSLGLASEMVDLRDFSQLRAMRHKLEGFDLLWVMGGNTFCLRHEMRRSGFEGVIGRLLQEGLVYGGESAGAVAAGTSLRGIEEADEPRFAERKIEEGLGLVPHFMLPHADNEAFSASAEEARKIHGATGKLLELKDSQAAIFSGGEVTLVESPS